jgi:hypothetical protein
MNDHNNDFQSPPLNPAIDEVAAEAPSFRAACASTVDELTSRLAVRLGQSLLTKSDEWGFIWRVDFAYADSDWPGHINRIICWRATDGNICMNIAVGQLSLPLPNSN